MLKKPHCEVIALEEHYWDGELADTYEGVDRVSDPKLIERLCDLGALRLREMDEAGVDLQVLSHVVHRHLHKYAYLTRTRPFLLSAALTTYVHSNWV